MDLAILKKRLSSFRTEGGYIRGVSNELLIDILRAWETWTGKAKEFYTSLGLSSQQMATLIQKGKRISKEEGSSEFREIRVEPS